MSAAPTLGPRLARVVAPEGPPPWRPVRRIGEGGMGVVWEVEHARLGRRAALKVLSERHRDRADARGRLLDEARALARIAHPGVPGVLDVGELSDGRPFFVMDLVTGTSLESERRRHGVVAIPTATRWCVELLRALSAVHGAALVHRDVKLENVVLAEDGERVVLVDFGVALALDADLRRTGRGRAVGTPRSMSPEQHALCDVDQRADLYAVGLCLFELVAGRGPFDDLSGSRSALLLAHCRRPAPSLAAVSPQLVPPALAEVVARALAKSPGERFETAEQMRAALEAAAGGRRAAVSSPRGSTLASPGPPPARPLLDLVDAAPGSSTREIASWELASSAGV